jgi:hypothetical protein
MLYQLYPLQSARLGGLDLGQFGTVDLFLVDYTKEVDAL